MRALYRWAAATVIVFLAVILPSHPPLSLGRPGGAQAAVVAAAAAPPPDAGARADGSSSSSSGGAPPLGAGPLVCVVVRTYWGHGTYGDSALSRLLWSLEQQTHANWRALLLVLDDRPFPDLRHLLRYAGDGRAQVFAEWIAARNRPRDPATRRWEPRYHDRLYALTDAVVRACPRATEWLVVTNGDNAYDPSFLARLVAEGGSGGGGSGDGGDGGSSGSGGGDGAGANAAVDAVAFDYYSRFQRPTAAPCERFAEAPPGGSGAAKRRAPEPHACKPNLMRWCHTDLAATAYRWRRFVGLDERGGGGGGADGGSGGDGLRFAGLDAGGISHDGAMAEEVARRGWRIKRVSDACLVEHAPSPQACAAAGRVWDDRFAATDAWMGGRCISAARAAAEATAAGVEEVAINVTHDASFGFPRGALTLRCLRHADVAGGRAAMRRYFPPACAAPGDEAGGGDDDDDEYDDGDGDDGDAAATREQ